VNVVGELQRKRTLAASRGFLAAARLSCLSLPWPHVVVVHMFFLYLGKLGTLHSGPKQCKRVLDFS